jgi:ATP-binding cassette subfamily B protein
MPATDQDSDPDVTDADADADMDDPAPGAFDPDDPDLFDPTRRPADLSPDDPLAFRWSPRRRQAFRLAVRNYARQMWTDRRVSIPAMLLPGVGGILVWFCPPLVIAAMLERFADGDRPTLGELTPYLLAFAAAWLGGEVVWRLGVHFLNRVTARGGAQLQRDGMDALLERDLAFFHDNFAGALTKKVVGYGTSYDVVVSTLFFQVASNLLPVFFVSFVLWAYSPWIVVTLLLMVTVTGVCVTPLVIRRQRLVDVREVAGNHAAGHVADSLSNIDAVRLFSREPEEAAVHARNVDKWWGLALRSWDYQNTRIDLVTSPLFVATNILGVVLAVTLAGDDGFSLAAVFVTFAYYTRFTEVMWEFNQIYRNLESHLSTAAQFTELLLDPARVTDADQPDTPHFADSGVTFERVTFCYPKRDVALFDGLDLVIEPGQKVGLVGPSGGGKTTLTRLLLRFADIDGGTIRLGGQDIARVRQADLRHQIAYVPQDPLMFHRSLRDNIAFGRLDATAAEIYAAAEAANATGFIEDLPLGYQTLVGERGIKLSGGQRQRLAIARAVLRDAPLLVLDEATSSLDSESEALIQQALLGLMADRTAIVIAHRLSTVRAMDRLVVLDGGRVVEDGTHDQLLAAGGLYASLWDRQSGGFLGATATEAAATQAAGVTAGS